MGRSAAIKTDLKYLWHPYTQMKDMDRYPPILIKKAKGLKLYDEAGKFYYDTVSSWWCNLHGHNHPVINRAISRQLKKVEHCLFAGFTHDGAIELAEALIKLIGHKMARVFYSDNGSTAIEVAMKISMQYWQNTGIEGKSKFLCLDRGYHGDTIGAISVGGKSLFNDRFKSVMFESYRAPSPYCYRCPFGKERGKCTRECLKAAEDILKANHREICAVIVEPLLMGAGGMIVYEPHYLAGLSRLAKKYNVHLILDEVATGFGRTGKMFAFEYVQDIGFDFICLSKALTAGYLPMAATLTTKKIYDAFYHDYVKGKTFFHGHTFTANPLACAAALASLDIFKREKSLAKAQKIIPLFHERLNEFSGFAFIGDVRAIGLVGVLELVKDKVTKEEFASDERIGFKIYQEGLKHNLILRPLGNVIYFFLPLSTTARDLNAIFANLHKVMAWFTQKYEFLIVHSGKI